MRGAVQYIQTILWHYTRLPDHTSITCTRNSAKSRRFHTPSRFIVVKMVGSPIQHRSARPRPSEVAGGREVCDRRAGGEPEGGIGPLRPAARRQVGRRRLRSGLRRRAAVARRERMLRMRPLRLPRQRGPPAVRRPGGPLPDVRRPYAAHLLQGRVRGLEADRRNGPPLASRHPLPAPRHRYLGTVVSNGIADSNGTGRRAGAPGPERSHPSCADAGAAPPARAEAGAGRRTPPAGEDRR